MAIVDELRAALGSLTAFRRAAAGLSREALAGGLAFYPAVGLAIGTVAAVLAAVPHLGGAAGVAALFALAGGRGPYGLAAAAGALLRPGDPATVLARLRGRPGAAGIAFALLAFATKTWVAAILPPPAQTAGFMLASMLGAWAIAVQCYGGSPALARGPAAALVGRARFREFAWASVVALGVTFAIADGLGVGLALVAALVTVGVRVHAHRRAGGLTGRILAATRELVETVVLMTLGLLAGAVG